MLYKVILTLLCLRMHGSIVSSPCFCLQFGGPQQKQGPLKRPIEISVTEGTWLGKRYFSLFVIMIETGKGSLFPVFELTNIYPTPTYITIPHPDQIHMGHQTIQEHSKGRLPSATGRWDMMIYTPFHFVAPQDASSISFSPSWSQQTSLLPPSGDQFTFSAAPVISFCTLALFRSLRERIFHTREIFADLLNTFHSALHCRNAGSYGGGYVLWTF